MYLFGQWVHKDILTVNRLDNEPVRIFWKDDVSNLPINFNSMWNFLLLHIINLCYIYFFLVLVRGGIFVGDFYVCNLLDVLPVGWLLDPEASVGADLWHDHLQVWFLILSLPKRDSASIINLVLLRSNYDPPLTHHFDFDYLAFLLKIEKWPDWLLMLLCLDFLDLLKVVWIFILVVILIFHWLRICYVRIVLVKDTEVRDLIVYPIWFWNWSWGHTAKIVLKQPLLLY